ncbi:MAG: hypothetical protein JSU88_02385 [Nitrospinaceae bacterium]|jgi:hypothetical protein|nr:MAG: hypothetical protein JSU88_02385 [Nitrospinaceae bacterium]
MKHTRILLLAVLSISFMLGCGTVGKNFDSSRVKNIQNKKTTQAEVLDWFGVPFKEGNENGHTMWTYQFDKYKLVGEPESRDLVILFDENQVVKAYRYTSSLAE